jgi:hypothetical protein
MPSRTATDVYLKSHCGDMTRACSVSRFARRRNTATVAAIRSSSARWKCVGDKLMGRRSFPSSAHDGKPRTWCARWRSARAPPSPGEAPFLETREVATKGKPTRRCCAQIRRRLLSNLRERYYCLRGGCGLWAGSESYLNICATIGPPTNGLSSASSASASSFS